VVGLGALGSQLVEQLASRGAGELLLIDFDRVEPANIGRDPSYTSDDVGAWKAEAMARRCRERFRATRFEAAVAEIADVGWEALRNFEVLFGCVDRDSARLEMARIATRLARPVCDGGLSGSRGRVSWFTDCCFGCRLTAARRRGLLQEWQSRPYPCGAAKSPQQATGISKAAAFTARVMARRAAEMALSSYTLEIQVEPEPSVEQFALRRNSSCPFHEATGLTPLPRTFGEALNQAREVGWEWPICTSARCFRCGLEWRPMIRAARLRSRGCCPACGFARLLEVETVRSVTQGSAWAAVLPKDLGLPENHLLLTRP
jgi:adenylyltransferase/sulfurtransferase